jgi:hypothetical protein
VNSLRKTTSPLVAAEAGVAGTAAWALSVEIAGIRTATAMPGRRNEVRESENMRMGGKRQ